MTGSFGSLHLADLGAEVIKIEDPRTGGDVGATSLRTSEARTRCSSRRQIAQRSLLARYVNDAGREVLEDLVRVRGSVLEPAR